MIVMWYHFENKRNRRVPYRLPTVVTQEPQAVKVKMHGNLIIQKTH